MEKLGLSGFQDPEHTGENRCRPCTVLNVGIGTVLSVVVSKRSKPAAALVFAISALVIYVRGYLVPGTPALTKRYLPPAVLRWFGKEPSPRTAGGLGTTETGGRAVTSSESTAVVDESIAAGSDDSRSGPEIGSVADEETPIDPESVLLTNGIIVHCDDADDLCIEDEVRTRWQQGIESCVESTFDASDAAAAFDLTDSTTVEITSVGDGRSLDVDERRVGHWPSERALLADVAAAPVLADEIPGWADLSMEQKGELLHALRLFLETCPGTAGSVEMQAETMESCCSSYDVVVTECSETGDRIFEQPIE